MNTQREINGFLWRRFRQLMPLQVILLLAAALQSIQSYAAPGDVDPSFDAGSTIDGQVRACAVQPDGKVLIGGDFNTLHGFMRGKIARLNGDGRTDATFLNQLGGVDGYGYVDCLALQHDGKVLLGGAFTSVNGVGRTNLARLNPDGSLDETFHPDFQDLNAGVGSMAIQSDNKIVIAGAFEMVNGIARSHLARLNPDGSLDESFNVSLTNESDPENVQSGYAGALVVQADSRLMIGGVFTAVNGVARTNLARLNPDGTLDEGFRASLAYSDGLGDVACAALQTDHKILVGGTFTYAGGVPRTGLARLNEDGTLDASFVCPQADMETYEIVPRTDGKLIALGSFTPDGVEWWSVALLNTNGTLETSFHNSAPDARVLVAALQADGRLFVGGEFWEVDGKTRRGIARLQSDGSLDSAFDNGGPIGVKNSVDSVVLRSDGKLIISGASLDSVNGQSHQGIALLNLDGSLDESFNTTIGGAYPYSRCLGLQSDGKILVAGDFSLVNGVSRNGVARLNPDGALDEDFLNGLAGANRQFGGGSGVWALAVQSDGKILIGGLFDTVNAEPRDSVARLNADGTLDPVVFDGYFQYVRAVLIQRDGKILVGGALPMPLQRFNPDGSRDNSFQSTATEVYCLAEQMDGKILAGGHFSSGIVQWNGIARILPDGTVDNEFPGSSNGPFGIVYRLAIDGDGKIIVAGDFNESEALVRNQGIVRLNSNGTLDPTFGCDLHQSSGSVNAIVIQTDTKIILGGYFSAVNQTPCGHLVRLMGSCVPPAIRNAPQSCTGEFGTTAWLGVVAEGFPPPGYQWFFNGTNALDRTNCWLELTNMQYWQSGTYTVVVTNAGGAITSLPVMFNVIPAVERRPVPCLYATGEAGSVLNIDYASAITPAPDWSVLDSVNLTDTSQFYFDLTAPLPPQRFYRAWQMGTPSVIPSLSLPGMVPAITLTGNIGDTLRLDYINQFGPTDAWVTLDTITLTNTSQLYFDVSAIGQPPRLWRILPGP